MSVRVGHINKNGKYSNRTESGVRVGVVLELESESISRGHRKGGRGPTGEEGGSGVAESPSNLDQSSVGRTCCPGFSPCSLMGS